jgi:hypothetical protein
MNNRMITWPSKPSIPVAMRHRNGRTEIAMVEFVPGMQIERCGKRYVVDKNGTQRRMK